jgi:hypothetical protein
MVSKKTPAVALVDDELAGQPPLRACGRRVGDGGRSGLRADAGGHRCDGRDSCEGAAGELEHRVAPVLVPRVGFAALVG